MHVLGNVMGPIFVYGMSLIAVSMILASGLSFLGLGVKPPEPEWGLMLNTLRTAIYTQPLLCALPGRDDLRHLDLLQPADRRPALGHGHQGMSDSRTSAHSTGTPLLEVAGPGEALPAEGRVCSAAPARVVRAVDGVDFSLEPRARRSASSANPAAASPPPRACSCT